MQRYAGWWGEFYMMPMSGDSCCTSALACLPPAPLNFISASSFRGARKEEQEV